MTFRTVGTALNVNNSTVGGATHNITMPTGSGGGILVTYAVNNPGTITPPSSPWVTLVNQATGGPDAALVFWLPPGSAQANTTFATVTATARSEGYMYRITGEDAWTPAVSVTTGSSVNPDSPTLSPPWGLGDTTWMSMGVWRNASATTLTTYPANYTIQQLYGANTGAAAGVGHGNAQRQNTVATEDPGAYTIGTSRAWGAVTIGIMQVAAGPVVKPRLVMPPNISQYY